MVKKHVHNLLSNNLSTIVKISYLSVIWFFFEKERFVLVLKLLLVFYETFSPILRPTLEISKTFHVDLSLTKLKQGPI